MLGSIVQFSILRDQICVNTPSAILGSTGSLVISKLHTARLEASD